jgi:hypothetical protein
MPTMAEGVSVVPRPSGVRRSLHGGRARTVGPQLDSPAVGAEARIINTR